jgi:hypothetical protein
VKIDTDLINQVTVFDIPNGVSNAFDVEAFDEAIRAHGVRFIHYRGMRNPVGLVDKYDSRRPDDDHSGASNGLIYTKAGCLTALFTGNSKDVRAMDGGQLNSANAQITPARHYDCTTNPVYLASMDRLYLEEESVLVTHQQLVEANDSNDDKLKFPAVEVLDLVDASNNRYQQGADFELRAGKIHWCTQRRPGITVESGVGKVYAVRYMYRPYWYIDRLMHEIRVAQSEHPITGTRTTTRMPQSALIQREYLFEVEKKDDLAPDSEPSRQVKSGRDGGFGPR